jgi:hypothetical protein
MRSITNMKKDSQTQFKNFETADERRHFMGYATTQHKILKT